MRVALASAGSTGDIAPFTGVAAELRQRGHQVVMTAQEDVAGLVTAAGVECAVIPGRARVVQDHTPGRGVVGQLQSLGWLAEMGRRYAEPTARALYDIVDGADVILFSPLMLLGLHIAEAKRIPSLGLYLQPLLPTRAYPPSMLGLPSLGGPLNRMVGEWFVDAAPRQYWPLVRTLRSESGLTPLRGPRQHRLETLRRGWPALQGWSRHVVPPAPDQVSNVRTVGYCWPSTGASWTPPSELESYLAEGPAPVVVGFGSAPVGDPVALRDTVLAAARRAGLRLVIQAGWAELGEVGRHSDDVYVSGYVPHEWLLPRAAALVHACGAGTTAAALRAGIPAVAVPVMMDQPFWARRLYELGVSPRPLSITGLTEDGLYDAFRTVTSDAGYLVRAQALAAQIATEDGNGSVADAVEQVGNAGWSDSMGTRERS
jgi:UDP:flavonoid glycosyltransferase YjiC (YdhE family)